MTPRFRNLSTLTMLAALSAFSIVPAARAAEESVVQADAARAMQHGDELVKRGDYQRAAAEFERASELESGPCPDCLLGVARAYSGARQYDAGIHVTKMALALYTEPADQARAYDQLGSLLTLKGDMNAARTAFGKAVELDASMAAQVRSSLAEALLKRAKFELAAQATAAQPAAPAEVLVASAH
jgi:tetratricopeptide (TPR) repeat protein